MVKNEKKSICPICGMGFEEELKSCRNCGYWYMIVTYDDNGNKINEAEYKAVRENVMSDTRFELTCPECGKQAVTFYDGYGITCSCGGFFSLYEKFDDIGTLKNYRKSKKWTQKQMADKYALSQAQYSKIENGMKPITKALLKLFK